MSDVGDDTQLGLRNVGTELMRCGQIGAIVPSTEHQSGDGNRGQQPTEVNLTDRTCRVNQSLFPQPAPFRDAQLDQLGILFAKERGD